MSVDIEPLLRAHPFCTELDDVEIAQLVGLAHVETFPANSFIFRENDPAKHLHLIVSGVIRLELSAPGGVRAIQTLDSDDALGLSWLHVDGRWMFDARVEEAATLVVLDGPRLHDLCEADHTIGFRLTRRLLLATTERLQATRMRLMDLYR